MVVSDVYRALWRERWFMLILTLLVIGLAYIFTVRETKQYTASSLVRVQQNVRTTEEAFGALLTGERLARTYEQIAETSAVRDLVRQDLGPSVPIRAAVIEAAQLSNLELLEISATDPSPEVATAVANAVPRALATFIEETGSFRDNITVVERASEPTSPSSPNLTLNLVVAAMLGLILAAGLALLRQALSDRIENVEELERVTGHPVIAIIPNLEFHPVVVPPAQTGQTSLRPVASSGRRTSAIEGSEPTSRWRARG